MVPESYYVALSAVLFTMGVLGVLIRRNPLQSAGVAAGIGFFAALIARGFRK